MQPCCKRVNLQTVHTGDMILKKLEGMIRISKGVSQPDACFFSLLTHSKKDSRKAVLFVFAKAVGCVNTPLVNFGKEG